MTSFIYGFTAARIQNYITASSRLRDIQGASQIVEDLCGSRFVRVLGEVGLSKDRILSAAAGGVRIESDKQDALRRLHEVWPLIAQQVAPGLEIHQAIVPIGQGGVSKALEELNGRLATARLDLPAFLPETGPLVRRSQRTGLAAVKMDGREPIDKATDRKRRVYKQIRRQGEANGTRLIDQQFMPENLAGQYIFSGGGDEETIAKSEDDFVALVHADGNDVGSAVRKVLAGENDPRAFKRFSHDLAEATREAVHQAVESTLKDKKEKRLLGRPILLGGDDLTILVRADRAIDFVESFIEAFESETQKRLEPVLGSGLSACAGVAFVKESFPFDRAYTLAESLCEQAKKLSKEQGQGYADVPSSLAMHRVTNSLPSEADDKARRVYSMGAYVLGGRHKHAPVHLKNILSLAKNLPQRGMGSLRTLLPYLEHSEQAAEAAFKRAMEVCHDQEKENSKSVSNFERALAQLTGDKKKLTKNGRTPLLDALILAKFTNN